MAQTQGAKVVVTGGAGFISSHTVDALIARGVSVCVVDDLSEGRRGDSPAEGELLQFIEAHIEDLDSLPLSENVASKPLSLHAVEKQVGQQYANSCRALHGMSCLGRRYFNGYSPRKYPASPYAGVISKFVVRLSRDKAPIVFGDDVHTRDLDPVADVARATVAASFSDRQASCKVAIGQAVDLPGSIALLREAPGAAQVAAEHVDARSAPIPYSLGDTARMRDWPGVKPEWRLADSLQTLVSAGAVMSSKGARA